MRFEWTEVKGRGPINDINATFRRDAAGNFILNNGQRMPIATLTNGGDATVKGMEFSYRQSLTFLPNWARGFQVFGNMTRLQVQGSNSADFSGFSPRTYAAGLSLIRPRFFVKCTYNFQGEIRTGAAAVNVANGIPANTSNYQGVKRRLGVDAQYSLSKRFSAYVAIVDLLGFEQVLRRYAPNTPDYAKPSRLQEPGYFTTVGVRGKF